MFGTNCGIEVWEGTLRYLAVNMLAATTGMRLGEIRGLRVGSIHDDYIEITTSWEDRYGLKPTKTNTNRVVPIPAKMSQLLTRLLTEERELEGGDFIFHGKVRNRATDKKVL